MGDTEWGTEELAVVTLDISRLNINVGGVPSHGFSGDIAAFAAIEDAVGAKLPESYAEFIRTADGGHPEVNCFRPYGVTDAENFFDIDWFYSLQNPKIELLEDALLKWADILGPGNLPVGRDGGGNQIYLDLNEGSSVWFYMHDASESRLKISDSFSEFLHHLFPNPDFI